MSNKEVAMPSPSEGGNSNYKEVDLPGNGTYLARCYGIAFLGTVKNYFGDEEKIQEEVAILWELPTEKREFVEGRGQQPVAVHLIYNYSSNEKSKLYQHINIWSEGNINQENIAGFKLNKLLGRVCLLSLEKKVDKKGDKTFQNLKVNAIATVPKGQEVANAINEPVIFRIDEFDKETFFKLPPLVRYECTKSKEFKEQGLDYEEMKKEGQDNSQEPEETKEDVSEKQKWV